MILINGRPEHSIAVSDRGLHYGDGLFETIAIKKGQPVHLQAHLQRLQNGCKRLMLPAPEHGLIVDEINSLIQDADLAVIKIILTRGSGGRGYRQPDSIQATRIVARYPFPDYPESYRQQGVKVRICKTHLGINPVLAGIKHLNRLEQVLARAEWSDSSIQEGLMLDHLGRVIEGTMSNLFMIKQATLVTSPVTHSGVAGIMRSEVIAQANSHELIVREEYLDQTQLMAADEVFLTNSIIGIWPIKQINEQHFAVGPITKQLIQYLDYSDV